MIGKLIKKIVNPIKKHYGKMLIVVGIILLMWGTSYLYNWISPTYHP